MSAKDAWQTIEYDEKGNVVGVRAGFAPIAKPRVKCYYGIKARKANRRKPGFTEAPIWSNLPQGWHHKKEQV